MVGTPRVLNLVVLVAATAALGSAAGLLGWDDTGHDYGLAPLSGSTGQQWGEGQAAGRSGCRGLFCSRYHSLTACHRRA